MHLASLSDRLRVTSVCRHWRRAFLQHAPLWSRLCLTRKTDEHLLTTFLKRAKLSPLDITLKYSRSPIPSVALLSPFTEQIRTLFIKNPRLDHMRKPPAIISGPLPLLRTLHVEDNIRDIGYRSPSTPGPLLFKDAVNVEEFRLYTRNPPLLSQFAFPNLTIFDFRTPRKLPASLLLNFLGASPSLQEIHIEILNDIKYEAVPTDRVIVLPCVKDFHLDIANDSFNWELATHLSCPSAEHARFSRMLRSAPLGDVTPEDIYPPSLSWTRIIRQYATGTVEQVELELKVGEEPSCSIAFRTSDEATLSLHYHHSIRSGDRQDATLNAWIGSHLFSRACRVIRDHQLLSNLKYLDIRGGGLLADNLKLTTSNVGRLLGSMGPLEELVLHECDLRPYLDPFLETPLFPDAIQPNSFPHITMLVIDNPVQSLCDNEIYAAAVIKLAKSQHARELPFQVMVLPPQVPSWVAEELLLSVNTVECGDDGLVDGDEDRS